ncbi:MAG TPA: hypothetical protein VNT51_04135 [Miltoncostaeaceae bacterium]|nr:hypothetical protein [Miltoncostaeaceae bacterium]
MQAAGDTLARLEVVAVVIAAAQGFLHLLHIYVLDYAVPELNADADASIAGWIGTAGTGAAALAAGWLALTMTRRRAPLAVLAVVLAYLSVDDMLALHERITVSDGTVGPIEHAARLLWPLLYLPVLALAFVVMWFLVDNAPRSIMGTLRAGLLMLVAAVLLEAASPLIFMAGFDHGYLVYESEVVLEEGLESAGWILVAGALVAVISTTEPPAGRGRNPRSGMWFLIARDRGTDS